MAGKYRWDERIDYAHHEAMVDFVRITRRTNDRIAAQNARLLGEVAAKNQKIVTTFQDKTLDVVKAIQPLEQERKTVSADGEVTHIVLRASPNIRLTDAARLAVTANVLMEQATNLVTQKVPGSRSSGNGSHGFAKARSAYLDDGGEGVPQPRRCCRRATELDPNTERFDETVQKFPFVAKWLITGAEQCRSVCSGKSWVANSPRR